MEKAKAERRWSPAVIPNPKAKLLDQVREVIRVKHYSIRTEEAYVQWVKRFIFFSRKEASERNGRSGDRGIPNGFSGAVEGRGKHTEPGTERLGISLQAGFAH